MVRFKISEMFHCQFLYTIISQLINHFRTLFVVPWFNYLVFSRLYFSRSLSNNHIVYISKELYTLYMRYLSHILPYQRRFVILWSTVLYGTVSWRRIYLPFHAARYFLLLNYYYYFYLLLFFSIWVCICVYFNLKL